MKRIIAIVLLVALLLVALLMAGCVSKAMTWQEQYDLGVRYLSEGKYGEAILAFNEAIHIDPRKAVAYIGTGDAYMALAGRSSDIQTKKEHLLNAQDMYEKAEELGDSSATEKIDQIERELDQIEQSGNISGSDEDLVLVEELKFLTQEQFDYAEEFRNGYAFAIQGIDCGYIDKEGNFMVYYQREDPVTDEDFEVSDYVLWQYLNSDHQQMWVSEDGLFPMYDRETGLWGYGDIHTGEMVIAPQYEDACPFREGRAVVIKREEGNSSAQNTNNSPFGGQDGIGAAFVDRYLSVIDASGNEIFTAGDMLITNTIEEIAYQDGTLWVVGKDRNDKSGSFAYLRDLDGNILEQLAIGGMGSNYEVHGGMMAYSMSDQFYRGDASRMCIRRTSGETYYIDSTGKETARVPDVASYGYLWSKGQNVSFYVVSNTGIGLFDEEGAITEPLYTSVMWFNHGIASATEDGSAWYLINEKGERVGSETFEATGNASEGLIAVKQNGKWGYADLRGEVVIPCQFASATIFTKGVAFVTLSEESEVYIPINIEGKEISGNIHALSTFSNEEGFYLIQEEGGWRHIYHVS